MPYLNLDWGQAYYEEAGEGSAVVLGHSFLCSGEMWREQVGPLSEGFRVVNIDYRGHGLHPHQVDHHRHFIEQIGMLVQDFSPASKPSVKVYQ